MTMRLPSSAIAMLAVLATAGRGIALEPCAIDASCAALAVHGPASPVPVGETAPIRVAFTQAADDGQTGGVDEIAGVVLTMGMPGLELADCSAPGPDGLNGAFTLPPGAAGRYRVVVQNLRCQGRAGCLCPGIGEQRDGYVNLLILGLPGESGVQPLPNGDVLAIAVRVAAGAPAAVPLHLYSGIDDAVPAGAGVLSIADAGAVDRTVDPTHDRLNVRLVDGELLVSTAPTATATRTAASPTAAPTTPTVSASATATRTSGPSPSATATTATTPAAGCVGDCDHSGMVSVNELIIGVGIALDAMPLARCPEFDCRGSGRVDVTCLIAGVNAALGGCAMP